MIFIGYDYEVNLRVVILYDVGMDNWWNTIKDKLVGPEFTWSKFLSELSAKFYLVVVQRQKEKEFMELKMSDTMTVMQCASKFTKLSRFVPEFVLSERLKMRRFEEGLARIFRIS